MDPYLFHYSNHFGVKSDPLKVIVTELYMFNLLTSQADIAYNMFLIANFKANHIRLNPKREFDKIVKTTVQNTILKYI